jgi:hypothetical protein
VARQSQQIWQGATPTSNHKKLKDCFSNIEPIDWGGSGMDKGGFPIDTSIYLSI